MASREELIQIRGWVRHWQDDVAANLKPSSESLRDVEAMLNRMIAERNRSYDLSREAV